MALHHKLCHTLGGTLDLPHAETHAILLPHTAAFNAAAAATALQPARCCLVLTWVGGFYDLARSLGAPTALRDFGVTWHDLTRIADLAIKTAYANPSKVTRDATLALSEAAWAGTRPPPDLTRANLT